MAKDSPFIVTPRPASVGARQQALMVKQLLEKGGWSMALAPQGPTPEHIPLMSTMWSIAWQAADAATRIRFGDHVLDFRYFRNRGWYCEVDGFQTRVDPVTLRKMLT